MKYTSDIAFTPAVKKLQEKFGSRKGYGRMETSGGWQQEINPNLAHILQHMDSFYFATSNSINQPYIQHRGGPKGFLKVLDNKRLAFADFSGNKQYISVGNLSENNKAYIFLMDYANQTRIKIWGTAEIVENDIELINSLSDENYNAKSERAIIFSVVAWDVNCRQHIQRRFTIEQIEEVTKPLYNKIKALKEEINSLKTNTP
ncbi:pyridoxamine 5'-phosphate oxidase family protein [Flavivirga spongiicola]|uniref:Pyridoxamine 5'-phosphate oxidase family protein n=1 Tax=Flavivirga spongiicola TaxID=421621 RepID=A0ABU7XWM9_9FLAO|nr:pyridoxamine 5'-phosphate oxidase family protein [Flavivirga sp. MEBiC05379]MDO5979845.1 pyridoxamine 5'-phosphate oxidase family protein [Flavivirga sp. MEBiC05379]